MSSANHLISIKDLEFEYQAGVLNLEISELHINKNEHIFLYGPSGSGKSTLLNIIAGILTPKKGEVLFNDIAVNSLSAAKRDHLRAMHMGIIFQSFNLIDYLSVLENILLPARLHPKQSFKQTQEKALHLLSQFNMSELAHKNIQKISVGQKQRVAAIRSFLMAPELIIADEPTSSLDQKNTEIFMQSLFEMAKENQSTILFVSHDDRLKSHFPKELSLVDINSAPAQAGLQ